MSATCKSCGASILWGVTVTGKRMPLDAKPVTVFVFVGARDEHGNPRVDARIGHVLHFTTCPHADQHRRRD